MIHFLQAPARRSSTAERLDDIRMTNGERRQAKAHLQQGERFADIVHGVTQDIGRFIAAVRAGGISLARSLKALLAKPARR